MDESTEFPRAVPSDSVTMRVADLPEPDLAGPVMLEDREGVFVHTFKCRACRLEFMIFSWLPNRHRVGTTFCPECGERTRMLHKRATVNERPGFTLESKTEIFGLSSRRDSLYMSDSE